MQEAVWRTFGAESCVAKTDIHLLRSNMLMKERIFVSKTYYATRSYCCVKEAFHTDFPNSATTLSDSSILRLVRKFEEAGSIQDKLRKERSHMAMTTERVKREGRWSFPTFAVTILCKYTDFVRFSEFHLRDLCLTLYKENLRKVLNMGGGVDPKRRSSI